MHPPLQGIGRARGSSETLLPLKQVTHCPPLPLALTPVRLMLGFRAAVNTDMEIFEDLELLNTTGQGPPSLRCI